MSKKQKKKPRSNLELLYSIRREWAVNPVTKVIPNKKKYTRKKKHKNKEE